MNDFYLFLIYLLISAAFGCFVFFKVLSDGFVSNGQRLIGSIIFSTFPLAFLSSLTAIVCGAQCFK